MRQSIDTARVKSSANKLRTVNRNIDGQFQTFRNSAVRISNNWSGRAAERAKTEMYKLFDSGTARSAVLQNYVDMLSQQVYPGYESAEDTNTRLADQFK